VTRVKELKNKKIEELKLKEEEKRAMAVLRSKQLDLNRLKELCQPRKVEGPVLSPLKPKPILTEAQIQRQNDSIKRLSKGYKKPAAES